MTERFDNQAYNRVGAPGSDRNRVNSFNNKTPVKPSTPDETQEEDITREITVLVNGKRYAITDDGDLDIRNKLTGMGISIQQTGDLMILTGSGGNGRACGGRLMINAKSGQITKSGGPIITEATADSKNPANGEGSKESGQSGKGDLACSNLYYGDAITECHGELKIKATNITIEAADVLSLVGLNRVLIQAGPKGGGEIQLRAGTIKEDATNKETAIIGQKIDVGAGEETTLQFDPRASKNLVSSGHLMVKVAGDKKEDIAGVSHTVVGGVTLSAPLVKSKDRTSSLHFDVALGNASMNTKVGSLLFTVGGIKPPETFEAGGISMSAAKKFNVVATEEAEFESLGFDVTAAAGGVNLTAAGGNVTIAGALIYLN